MSCASVSALESALVAVAANVSGGLTTGRGEVESWEESGRAMREGRDGWMMKPLAMNLGWVVGEETPGSPSRKLQWFDAVCDAVTL